MGEVRTRRIVASSLVMLLVLLVPVSAEENDSVSLQIETLDENSKPWYGVGDTVVVSSSILNEGVATSITEDPSCGTVMIITNSELETIIDESVACRGQSRGLDIASGVTPLEQHQWDLNGPDGLPVTPGLYTYDGRTRRFRTACKQRHHGPTKRRHPIAIGVLNIINTPRRFILYRRTNGCCI
jgi:hypothetical protein